MMVYLVVGSSSPVALVRLVAKALPMVVVATEDPLGGMVAMKDLSRHSTHPGHATKWTPPNDMAVMGVPDCSVLSELPSDWAEPQLEVPPSCLTVLGRHKYLVVMATSSGWVAPVASYSLPPAAVRSVQLP